MAVSYNAVGWNRQKRIYDSVVGLGIVSFVLVFAAVQVVGFRAPNEVSLPIVLIRALGACAIVMLHVILAIGPLCRFDRRFLPLLYNRRHLGVMMFMVALAHGALATLWYHGFGNVNPLLSLLGSNVRFDSFREFPFELLGILGLAWLFVMAATSHDFWLKNLSPRVWKNLHMGVYVAYGVLVAHVALGLMQSEQSPVFVVLMGAGVVGLTVLHVGAGVREMKKDKVRFDAPADAGAGAGGALISAQSSGEQWHDVCELREIGEDRAVTVCLNQGEDGRRPERVAVYRQGDKVSAVGNVCRHQGGPLGEGKIVGGCITCPWHGYQYKPEDGCSPPPFDDRVPVYAVRVVAGRVEVRGGGGGGEVANGQ